MAPVITLDRKEARAPGAGPTSERLEGKDLILASLSIRPEPDHLTPLGLRSELIRIHQEKKDSVIPAIPEVEETDELLPEVAAAIMHTEEQGIHLGMTPRRMFDHLFPAPSGRDEPLLPVSFIAPSQPLENVVIPLGTPGFNVAVEDAAIIASAVDDNVAQPKESIFSESFTEQTVKPKHDITSTDPRTIEYYVGGSISSTTTSSTSSDHWENVEAMQDKDRQEFLHMAETQSHFSQIQLRGTKPPPWFPGPSGVMDLAPSFYFSLPFWMLAVMLESQGQVKALRSEGFLYPPHSSAGFSSGYYLIHDPFGLSAYLPQVGLKVSFLIKRHAQIFCRPAPPDLSVDLQTRVSLERPPKQHTRSLPEC
uniref:Uncharacterized protein n=1 Tax=Timema shepardi TaxID=629360 RepID=A0A7R9G3P4_TIMSH|nr:unnamed protein product [Timema shepardi]